MALRLHAMKKKYLIKFCLCCLVLAGVLECLAQDTIAFKIIRNVAIIEGDINGTLALFIIDTGASITLLNESLSTLYNFRVVDNKYFARRHIVGLGGRSMIKEVRSATIKIGAIEIKFINKASDLDNLTAYFDDREVKIAGILGTDVMTALGGKIDFSTSRIIFTCLHK
ncbi:Aspartyl protease [Ohtaekwangia koreensis]|uniref:Aspartyl protease n=2 Tax=Ohtaekwangia koreensis TaxID=688867 RepID=A0A1T5M7I7_9BACT|nr:Aspartyl protease [Ohtaekwangia koreensis]